MGNTLIVVEHDEDTAADYLVDIGPKAGVHGGEKLQWYPEVMANEDSLTGVFKW